ncbi:hypothetical protein FS837_012759 [Tulasnella sp. UAMH 9824]|nr:hypothetical protein FS837_012759 [Tulasnella sp. UAMH 9824]
MDPASFSDRHGDQSTTWKLLLDFPCEFTDDENVTRLLLTTSPTRDAILDSLREANSARGSVLIYYGGHCENRPDGTSSLDVDDATESSYYCTQPNPPQLRSRSYLIPSDAQRLYGEDILACLPAIQNSDLKCTFVLDACESEPLLELAYRYDERGMRGPNPGTAPLRYEQGQLVVVSAARRGEPAGTIVGPESTATYYGFLTYYLLHRLSKPCLLPPSALCMVMYLNRKSATNPDPQKRQHISITSRRPIVGAFEILPKSSHSHSEVLTTGSSTTASVVEKE